MTWPPQPAMPPPPPGGWQPAGQPPRPDDSATFDLLDTTRKSVYRGAAVAVFFGGIGFYCVIAIFFVSSLSVVAKLGIAVLVAPLLAVTVMLILGSVGLRRAGRDVVVIDATGIVRTSKAQGFAVEWQEIARIDVVATDGVPGYDPFKPGNTKARKFGGATALRVQPVDASRFAAIHPTLDTRTVRPIVAQLVAAPFGAAFTMGEPDRSVLAQAVQRWAGTRFQGRTDETARAAMFGSQPGYGPQPPGHGPPPGWDQPLTDGR